MWVRIFSLKCVLIKFAIKNLTLIYFCVSEIFELAPKTVFFTYQKYYMILNGKKNPAQDDSFI
jgi:hypothetical protein